ncbi:MAG: hypothetical protein LBG29_08310 [Synergistaceae bacterium]|jgi:hypothetical protein|nr:hypothetical protein [Synergistaceae bacterium]
MPIPEMSMRRAGCRDIHRQFEGKGRLRIFQLWHGVIVQVQHVSSHEAGCRTLQTKQESFRPVVMAARMMMAAGGEPQQREKYAGEHLKIMRERDYDNMKKSIVLKFDVVSTLIDIFIL